jgi:hypothetical protein
LHAANNLSTFVRNKNKAMIHRLFLSISFLFILFSSQGQTPHPKQYVCYHIDQKIQLDGEINDSLWQLAAWTDDFINIEGPDKNKPPHQTRVKMLWDDSFLYVAAYMQEPHIWAYLTEDEKIMYFDNDFEIFIDPDGDNHNYYEFEFNALNKKWDLFLERPYRDSVTPDLKWNCKGLRNATKVYGSINNPKGKTDSAWTMEIAIPLNCIQQGVADQHIWRINFSRVEWETRISGKKYKKLKKPEKNCVWSSQWAINMHRPEYWGYLQFSKEAPGTKQIQARKDPLWDIKMQLMKIYYFQRNFYKKEHRYSEALPSNLAYPSIHLNIEGNHFIASYHQDWGELNINEKGRIWRTKMHASPRFWVWMHPHPKYSNAKWDSVFVELKDLGIQGVLMGANTEELKRCIPIAAKYQIEIHAWIWTLNRRDAPKEYLSVNAEGKSLAEQKAYVDYYQFMSPILPEVHDFVKLKIAQLERIDGLAGIHLDYVRYVDVFLPKGLLPKYHITQDSVMPQYDYGYHPKMLEAFKLKYGSSPLEIPNFANNAKWQQFRMDQITKLVNSISEDSWSKEVELSAAVFPDPKMSRRMVRQDWAKWNLDFYFPMVYNGFYNAGTYWIEQRMKVSRELLPNARIICGLYLPHCKTKEQLLESMKAAFAGGASGIAFFDYRGLTTIQKEAIRELSRLKGVWISQN